MKIYSVYGRNLEKCIIKLGFSLASCNNKPFFSKLFFFTYYKILQSKRHLISFMPLKESTCFH